MASTNRNQTRRNSRGDRDQYSNDERYDPRPRSNYNDDRNYQSSERYQHRDDDRYAGNMNRTQYNDDYEENRYAGSTNRNRGFDRSNYDYDDRRRLVGRFQDSHSQGENWSPREWAQERHARNRSMSPSNYGASRSNTRGGYESDFEDERSYQPDDYRERYRDEDSRFGRDRLGGSSRQSYNDNFSNGNDYGAYGGNYRQRDEDRSMRDNERSYGSSRGSYEQDRNDHDWNQPIQNQRGRFEGDSDDLGDYGRPSRDNLSKYQESEEGERYSRSQQGKNRNQNSQDPSNKQRASSRSASSSASMRSSTSNKKSSGDVEILDPGRDV